MCTFQNADRKYSALHTKNAWGKQKQWFPLPSTIVIFLRLVPHLISFDCFCLPKDFIYSNGSFWSFVSKVDWSQTKLLKISIFHQFYCFCISVTNTQISQVLSEPHFADMLYLCKTGQQYERNPLIKIYWDCLTVFSLKMNTLT